MALPLIENERVELVRLRDAMPDAVLGVKEYRGDTFILLDRAHIVAAVEFLKGSEELAYDYFVECLGVDYLTWTEPRDLAGRFEVVYNLFSTKHSSRIFLKVGVSDGETIPTLKHVFLGAEYPEREVADLFGVVFDGNENPGRFLLPDDWVGFPLRKDVGLGGEDVLFDGGDRGPAIEDRMVPHAGESFEGKTGSRDVSGR